MTADRPEASVVLSVGVRALVGLCDADAATRSPAVRLLRRSVSLDSSRLWDTSWSATAVGEWEA